MRSATAELEKGITLHPCGDASHRARRVEQLVTAVAALAVRARPHRYDRIAPVGKNT
jgi:hypothetical protein